jgi:anthraniloyl-CoA monooxygenase
MRVRIVGAGPAGLYLAILLKKADPGHEVIVLERNASDATFGWGVVFSEETLSALRDADPATHAEITDTFVRWDRLDIHYQGHLLRSRGHAFSAISRKVLLAILQQRCRKAGVDLRFGVDIGDAAEIADSADLIVGADGVNSVLRRAHQAQLGSSVEPQGCRYAWFGTDLVLDAFTFVFKDTDHGFLQVHAYPFDERTSTWIVECPEATWRRSELDAMSEDESLAFCQGIFREELDGHRLLSNRSTWNRFSLVRNESWHDGNLVLLGDAAHTAHFSVGSGTKLAMEDAIALANALGRHGRVAPALLDYELERQPVVERLQGSASESAAYFERVSGFTHMAPMQFAFNLLTRSGRVTHANLTVRDPGFMRSLDAWFTTDSIGATSTPAAVVAPPPAFAPLRLGGVDVRNRIVLAPGAADRLAGAAAAGAGLVLSNAVAVCADGRITADCPTLADDRDAAQWASVAGAVHAAGARLALQLTHAGRRGATRPSHDGIDIALGVRGWPLISASAIAYGPFSGVPQEMGGADMARVRDDFVRAAALAARAGVDVLELDFAHGHLVASFVSPLTNRRVDEHAGSLTNRLRWPLEVLDAVAVVWPSERPLAVRLSITDWSLTGVSADEGIEVAAAMASHGATLIHVVAGQTVIDESPPYRRGFLTALSDRVRNEARVPTLVGGYLTTLDELNTIVGAGRADLCVLDVAS